MIKILPTHSFSYDGVKIDIYHANKGEGLPRHEHEFNHANFCNAGKCAIRKQGIEVFTDKNYAPIDLKANEWHEIEALEDGTVFINVFAESKY